MFSITCALEKDKYDINTVFYAVFFCKNMGGFSMKRKIETFAVIVMLFAVMFALPALAIPNPVQVSSSGGACEPTMISATAPGATVSNMYLVVDNGTVQYENIPTDGSSADLFVGPFFVDTNVSWRVFGGGERDYDMPLWNGYGTPTFSADIGAYAASVGGYDWVLSGTSDPNPFTTWNNLSVQGCYPETMADCKKGGWETYGFKNQGQCVRYVETGKDSRLV